MNKQVTGGRDMPVGIIGFGDLGKRLAAQILLAGYNVSIFDSNVEAGKQQGLDKAVDPAAVTSKLGIPLAEASASAVLENCNIAHWAVPSAKLNELPPA